ncbi:MAG: VOC family protein [Anaerolineae bacterium]
MTSNHLANEEAMSDQPLVPSELFRNVAQIGVVVRDLERTTELLSAIFGIGPFRKIVYPPAGRDDMQRRYFGQEGDFCYVEAFADLGNVELEIIQPISGKSIWSDFLAAHGEGIHHIRFNVDDMQAVTDYLASHDICVGMSGNGLRPGTQWANFDCEGKIGFTIEIMKALAGTDGRTPQILDGQVQS